MSITGYSRLFYVFRSSPFVLFLKVIIDVNLSFPSIRRTIIKVSSANPSTVPILLSRSCPFVHHKWYGHPLKQPRPDLWEVYSAQIRKWVELVSHWYHVQNERNPSTSHPSHFLVPVWTCGEQLFEPSEIQVTKLRKHTSNESKEPSSKSRNPRTNRK